MILELTEEQVEMVRSALRSHRKYLQSLGCIEGTGTLKTVYESISKTAVAEIRLLDDLDTTVMETILSHRRLREKS